MNAPLEVRYGYTLADVQRLARDAAVASSTTGTRTGWWVADRVEVAFSAIAEALLVAQTPPTAAALAWAGRSAIFRHLRDDLRNHGVDYHRYHAEGTVHHPRWVRFWALPRTPTPEELVVDSEAVRGIWAALDERDRRVLAALATCRIQKQAAHTLGMSIWTFNEWADRARRRFAALWFEGQTPPAPAFGRSSRRPRSTPPAVHTDRAAAQAALEVARTRGMRAAQRAYGVSDETLYRAWRRHGLGLPHPDHHQTRAARATRRARRAQGGAVA